MAYNDKRHPTEQQKRAFFLRCTGLSFAEVAIRMGISKGNAGRNARLAANRYMKYPEGDPNRALAFAHFKPARSCPRPKHLKPGETIP